MKTYEDMRMMKIMEINSFIISELSYVNAPTWVRPAMLWDERWERNDCPVEKAKDEAREKIKQFVPLCSEHLHRNNYLERMAI